MRKPHFERLLAARPELNTGELDFLSEQGLIHITKKKLELTHGITNSQSLPQDTLRRYIGLAHMNLFRQKGQIFKIATELSECLESVKLDLSAGDIPHEQVLCIEFPDGRNYVLSEDKIVNCCYIFTHKGEVDLLGQKHFGLITFIFPWSISNSEKSNTRSFTWRFTSLNQTVEDILDKEIKGLSVDSLGPINKELFRYVLNCLLYINSGDPDLRHLKAAKPPATMKAKKLRLWYKNNTTLDMTMVGFNFKKPILFSNETALVSGHFRWQPFGKGLAQIKLIWIEPHERRYTNVRKETAI